MSASIDRREFLARTVLGAAALAVPLPTIRDADAQPAGRDVRLAPALGGGPQRRLA